jgi:Tfp pilus assembly protein PilP
MRALAIAIVFASSVAAVQTPARPAAPAPAPAPKPAAPATGQVPAPKPGAPAPAAPAPAPAPAPPAGAQMQPPSSGKPPAPEAYVYNPDNRRDPFISLIGTGGETTTAKKGEGAASMIVAEISVRGIMQSRGGFVAMVEGPDKKTYIVHPGDRFADGTIKSIMPTGLVVIQEVNDPLSLVKQREVRKLLRSLEDAKE